jgi:hypothetical protein
MQFNEWEGRWPHPSVAVTGLEYPAACTQVLLQRLSSLVFRPHPDSHSSFGGPNLLHSLSRRNCGQSLAAEYTIKKQFNMLDDPGRVTLVMR